MPDTSLEKKLFRCNSACIKSNSDEYKVLLAIPISMMQTQNVESPQSPTHSIYSQESMGDEYFVSVEPVLITENLSVESTSIIFICLFFKYLLSS